MLDPIKPKAPTTKSRLRPFITLSPDDSPVNVGNKPKAKFPPKGPMLLTTKGQVVLINIRPKLPASPEQPLPPPSKRDLVAIPVREATDLSFAVKLDLPETSNLFYGTETRRQTFIREQLYSILTVLGLSHNYHNNGEIEQTSFVEALETKGYEVEIELKENASF